MNKHIIGIAIMACSGAAALMYELLWTRALHQLIGSGLVAAAIIVGLFFLGLGIGAGWASVWADRLKHPLRTYGLIELAAAGLNLLGWLLAWQSQLFTKLSMLLSFSATSITYLGYLLAAGIFFLPLFIAIGMTVPVFSKWWLDKGERAGNDIATLYTANTLGGIVGIILLQFLILPFLTVTTGFLVASGFSLVLAAAMIAFWQQTLSSRIQPLRQMFPPTTITVLLFVLGFVGIGMEMLWFRLVARITLATSQAFAVILAIYLLGIVIGAWIVRRAIDTPSKNRSMVYRSLWLMGLFTTLEFLALAAFEALIPRGVWSLAPGNPAVIIIAGILIMPTSVLSGMLFPLLTKTLLRDMQRTGSTLGLAYMSNAAGGLAGALIVTLFLIPAIMTKGTAAALSIIMLAIAGYVLLSSKKWQSKASKPQRNQGVLLSICTLLVLGALLIPSSAWVNQPDTEVLYLKEGFTSQVMVMATNTTGEPVRVLLIDRQAVAADNEALLNDAKLLGYLPLFLANDPKTAFTIGFGTGVTSSVLAGQGLEVTAAEIEPRVLEASDQFLDINLDVLDNPHLRVITDDGRAILQQSATPYDLILTDVTSLKFKTNPSLYTVDHFSTVRDRLTPNGLAVAWVPVSGLSFKDLQIIIASFQKVFPHTTVWKDVDHYILLIGSPETLQLDPSILQQRMTPAMADLQTLDITQPEHIIGMLLLGEKDVHDLVQGVPLHTDNQPTLEFSDPSQYMVPNVAENLQKLIAYQHEDLAQYVAPSYRETARAIFSQRNQFLREHVQSIISR